MTERFGVPMLHVIVENVGDQPIILTGWGLRLPRRRGLPIPWPTDQEPVKTTRGGSIDRLPATLDPGKHAEQSIDQRLVLHRLAEMGYAGRVRVRAFWWDRKRRQHRSDPLVLDLDRPDALATRPAPRWRFWERRG